MPSGFDRRASGGRVCIRSALKGARTRPAFVAASAVLAFSALPARAENGAADASYGRIDGDVAFVVAAGVVVAARGARLEGEVRVRYLETGGVYAVYEDGFDAGGAEPRRLMSAGVELRPLFLARWLRGLETERPRIDMMVDSLGLQLGAAWSQPGRGAFGSIRGLDAAIGLELPIGTRATGPWVAIRAGLRWSEQAMATGLVRNPDDRSAYLAVTLAWHQLVVGHLVDAGDEAPP